MPKQSKDFKWTTHPHNSLPRAEEPIAPAMIMVAWQFLSGFVLTQGNAELPRPRKEIL